MLKTPSQKTVVFHFPVDDIGLLKSLFRFLPNILWTNLNGLSGQSNIFVTAAWMD